MAGPQEQQLQLEALAGLHGSAPSAEFRCGLPQSSPRAREMGSPVQAWLLGAHSQWTDHVQLGAPPWGKGPDQPSRAVSGEGHGGVGTGDWSLLWSLSLAVEDFSRVVRPVTEEAGSLYVAPGSRTRSSGKFGGKSGRTFQPGCLVMQRTDSRGGDGSWLDMSSRGSVGVGKSWRKHHS